MAEATPAKEQNEKDSKPENPGRYSPSADEQALIEKWKKRFEAAARQALEETKKMQDFLKSY